MIYLTRNMRREGVAGDSSPSSPDRANDAVAHIKVGAYYEIDLSNFSRRSPEQLKTIRIVLVSKKTANYVSLRFPSMYSLRSYFGRGVSGMSRMKPERSNGVLPVLDESHVMDSELAGEVLYRRIPPHEISMKRNSWSFWVSASSDLRKSSQKERITWPAHDTRLYSSASRKGLCCSELKSAGMIKWGKRRCVQYQSRHVVEKKNEEENENFNVKEEGEEEIGKEEMDEEDCGNETEGTDEGTEKGVKVDVDCRNSSHKRKRHESDSQILATRGEETKKQNQIVVYKKRVTKKFIDRWSVERYKLAEKNMLKVMKEKNAVFGNPVLRSELRSEARKWIGDTGLLDHLLKHMAGKVAPGGQDRFRRRHNADGAMEYWLESSDLMNVRKEAGVQDPYWTPPPGWKLGDNPTQDPVCAREIREIKEVLAALKREMEKLSSKKQDEDLAMVTTPSSCVTSQNLDHDNLMIPAKEMYTDLLKKKDQIEEQLMIVSESLRKMEEDIGWLTSTVEPCPNQLNSKETTLLLMESPPATTGDPKEVDKENQITESKSPIAKQTGSQSSRRNQPTPPQNHEEKAVKTERLKSGFKICKPVGSFLWPSMAAAATMLSPNHNNHQKIVIPTITFAPSPSHQPGTRPFSLPPPPPQACPVKPLPGKRSVLVPLPFSSPSAENSMNRNESPTDTKAGCFSSCLAYK